MSNHEDEEIPPRFRDFADRHGFLPIYSLWGAALILGCFSLLGGLLFLSSRDVGREFVMLTSAGILLLVVSALVHRRKKRMDENRLKDYRNWLRERQDPDV